MSNEFNTGADIDQVIANSTQKMVNYINYLLVKTQGIGYKGDEQKTYIVGNLTVGGHPISEYALKQDVADEIHDVKVLLKLSLFKKLTKITHIQNML